LRALLHTGAAGLVHGGVSLATLRWDGNNLQLVDFEQAYQVGEPRRRSGTAPSRSPEQADGVGTADARDDIWGAGAVIHEITTGRHTNGGRYDLSQDPEALRFLLHGVFAGQAVARPDATELLQRLRADTSVKTAPGPGKVLAAGRQAFEEACARKRGWPPEPPPPAPPESAKSTIALLVGGGVVLLVVLIAVVILGAMS
ncbi:MAG: hypothetical protein LC799_04235, partial [Actinobacteria bacterium]|nr:hypothetical protein [Actinomycetota bacterium]